MNTHKFALDPEQALAPERNERRCEWPGCAESGLHRAPYSREDLNTYRWFCMDHVREYNKSWNYYAGMSEEEVEADRRRDTVWHRPSWPLGGAAQAFRFRPDAIFDDFGSQEGAETGEKSNGSCHAGHPLGGAIRKALSVMGLEGPVTPDRLKSRYKELVKRHHPDANGGDKESEEKFKEINLAYGILMESYGS